MANSNVAFGFRPYGVLGSAANTTGTTEYRIASDNSNPIFQGMAVIPLAAGVIDDLQAAAGGNVSTVGVFNGCEYVSSTTAVFANIALATGNSGSTTTGISSATADLNTIATTNTLFCRIMGVLDDPENSDFTAAGIPLIVRLNNHFNAPTGSIAAGTVSTTGV